MKKFWTLLSLMVCFAFQNTYAQRVKVLTYNIHYGNPPAAGKGVIDLESIAKVINDLQPDVVALQEIDIKVSRSNMENQVLRMVELTGMDYYFSKGVNLEDGYYGVLILTKHKIINKRRHDLPMPVESENRTVGIIDIELPNGLVFSLFNTHFDLKAENQIAQAKFINELADIYSRPLILAGDLNAAPKSEPIDILAQYFSRKEDGKPTFPAANPTEELDYIMVGKHRKFKWIQYKTIPEHRVSDHLPVFAEIEFE